MDIPLDPQWKSRAFKVALFGGLDLYIGLITREVLAEWLAGRETFGTC
jgi:hypothetical protein